MDKKGEILLKGYSLLEFSSMHFDTIPDSDWIFFYSKNAVKFFSKKIDRSTIQRPCACMGIGTAKFAQELGWNVEFVGKGSPHEIALTFLGKAKNKRVLFPRALHSKKSIQTLLENEITFLDLVVYENKKKKKFPHPHADFLIFTSPLNVEAYLDLYPLKDESIMAIGTTTEQKLLEYSLKNVLVSPEPNEKALADFLQQLL